MPPASGSIDMPASDIGALAEDRASFERYVYTPLAEAVMEIERRHGDREISSYVEQAVTAGVPEPLKGKKSIVLFRHIATPNYEIRRFLMYAQKLPDFQPIILEYTADKFTNRNEWKYSLGKLRFRKGTASNGSQIFENENIIDFNASNFKPISSVVTKWGESLVDFHHDFFASELPEFAACHYDLSDWLHVAGPSAKEYYPPFFSLFLRDGILFENFLLEGMEKSFTQEIILPSLQQIFRECGHKPLIVALEPTDIEQDKVWLSYPGASKVFVDNKEG